MLVSCYVAAEIVLPIVLAFVLSLALTPVMRVLERVHLAECSRRQQHVLNRWGRSTSPTCG
jgi:predicted PurR-regulated permease PerM